MSRNRREKVSRLHKGESASPKREHRLQQKIAILVLVVLAVAGLAIVSPPGQHLISLVAPGSSAVPRAAILDQLSLTFPNPAFAESATEMLEQAGYVVDYYEGEEVTVELYRNLPARGYDFVILRVHAGLVEEIDRTTGSETLTEYVSLFTGEPYSDTKYVEEIKAGPLGIATSYEGGPQFFGIGPEFIESRMNGRFDNTTIVLMGCDGLRSDRTARAFLERGASTFISWDRPVSATHTDAATERLLRYLVTEKLPTAVAVEQTMAEVGPDPTYEAVLRFYPLDEQS